jgi:hypothetical protein
MNRKTVLATGRTTENEALPGRIRLAAKVTSHRLQREDT